MAKNPHRTSMRASDAYFDFQNRKAAGLPERDTEAQRADKERAKAEWMAANAVKKLPERKVAP